MSLKRRDFLIRSSAAAALLAAPSLARAASDKLEVIRLAGPGNASGRPYGNGNIGLLRGLELLEKEFEADKIRIEWQFPRGTGPAINEALANRQLDFASYGGLPNIVGRGAGVPTKVLAGSGVSPTYVAARPEAGIKTLEDLKGKRVAFQRGTIFELSLYLILAKVGLTNDDVVLFDIQGADQIAAIQTGDVDVIIGQGNSVLTTVAQGLTEVVYTTKGSPAPGSTFGSFTVHEQFAAAHPEVVERVLTAFVEASHWGSQEENRDKVFDIFAETGTPRESYVKDYEGDKLADRHTPLLDGFYRHNIDEGLKFTLATKLVRKPFDVAGWIDDSQLSRIIEQKGWQKVWTPRSSDGQAIG
ncbi:ABC transporter substrate-binding protein [Paracoccus aminophilus]|uniref:ABC-type nitrate/sulfonate/bicarbonate transport systems, periplasmic component n=1 Tax=Paracoccus aminophilus JCM 7686 TaxID=1367847 RepID=S5YIR3_PARAH|nr:ABC transporter substrate-binding protein [Paracoccus aminophilus]AGT11363.1 ABC-type nitrate/sulfonate/bicarbonate transport systems, periplasmic component [Paracoccus aminophilus JCM 7686]